MGIKDLVSKRAISEDKKRNFQELLSLLDYLKTIDLHDSTVRKINEKIGFLNTFFGTSSEYFKQVMTVKNDILEHLQKEHDLVPEKHYFMLWMTLGMSAFGLPFGVFLFAITENPAFIAVGLPLGLGLGSLYGASLDKKAEAENRVLKQEKK